MKETSKILIIGCGNSLLSEEIYDSGYKNITNIDYSSNVLKKMEERSNEGGRNMIFKVMDALNMEFEEEEFDIIIDKGTLDAMFTDTTQLSIDKIDKLFNEIGRVMKSNGKYICISLFQEHIIEKLLEFFCIGKNNKIFENYFFMNRVTVIELKEQIRGSKYQPFVFVAQKMKLVEIPAIQSLKEKCSVGVAYKPRPPEGNEELNLEQVKSRIKNAQFQCLLGQSAAHVLFVLHTHIYIYIYI